MDMITMEHLKEILAKRSDWCVSLFMPTHRAGKETEQNPIRFKNLLSEAEKKLKAKGFDASKVDAILTGPRNLFKESTFWQHQSDGLAVFFARDTQHIFRLPFAFDEKVVVTTRFHIKPLLPILNSDGTYYILAISQNQVRLLEGNQYAVDEVGLGDTPKAFAKTLPSEWPKQNLQYHTGTPSGVGNQAAMYHGHDSGSTIKQRLQDWFRTIDKAVTDLLANTHAPLVLAGVETLFPLYKEVNTYSQIMDEGIPGNPDMMSGKDLHPKAWAIVEPMFRKEREVGLAKYRQLAGTGLTTSDITEALIAASHGRVEVLFVALGDQIWGQFDSGKDTVHLSETQQPEDEDLLDLAAVQTLINGGSVFAVSSEDIPTKGLVAAVFRY